ncbi:acyltransferase [Phenylobacterium sp.]|uniref:acyltransferase family protein n=1 Tax=Phenylobacterium sp. TaxID=1871053 RepID=UPI0012104DBA|nr:acyltransferase [Phenylobacterium sp.]THD60560.1 MAG: acyltransferase [Phenylobacterium sp.]
MVAAKDSPEPGSRSESEGRYVFLDYLRTVAAWLVVWDHLANIVPEALGHPFIPAHWVRDNITGPLGVIQDFGWFGVALFFLISGFIISDRAAVESPYKFIVRRVLRIYPMVILAVLLSMALGLPTVRPTLGQVLLNFSLINYLIAPQVVLLGVAWTLIIEVVFYAITALTQFMRRSPHRIALNLVFSALVIWKRGAFGPDFALLATVASYLPVLVMGQIVYWWLEKKRLSWIWGFAYLAAACAVFLYGLRAIQPGFLVVTNSYFISVAYAFLLFVALMHIKLPQWPIVRFLSDTSYSVYLMHGLVGWQLLIVLTQHHLPLTFGIPLSAAASLAAACVTFWLVEKPTQRLARILTRNR